MDEQQQEADDQLSEARRQVRVFQELLTSPAWVELAKIAEVQVHNRRQKHIFQPLASSDGVLQQQWELGEAGGIELFMRLPQNIIDGCLAILEERKQYGTDEEVAG